MKYLIRVLALGVATNAVPVVRAEPSPSVTIAAFEPPENECFDIGDKYRAPELIVPPHFKYPFERRSGPAPRAVILVHLDETGRPQRLAVLSSTGEIYSKAAIEGLQAARWRVDIKRSYKSVWFYFPVVFELHE